MINQLVNTYIFQDLSFSDLEDIAGFCTLLEMHDGEALVRENENGDRDFFILCAGSVEIVSSSSAVTSGEVVISKQDKELFGEISWLTSRRRTATVRCRGPVEAIRVNGAALNRYMEENSIAGYRIMRRIAVLMSERLEGTNSLLKQILWNTRI